MTSEYLNHNSHIFSQAADYALGLLAADERRRVEEHARECADCRHALRMERNIEALVRGAVHQAAAPAPGRLAALRPAARPRAAAPLYRRLAPVTLVTVFLALGLLFGRGGSPLAPAVFGASPTQTMTSTHTHTPTATLAAAEQPATDATIAAGEGRLSDVALSDDAPIAPAAAAEPLPAGAAATPIP